MRQLEQEVLHTLEARTAQELESLSNNIPGGVYACRNDEDYTLTYISPGFLSLLGYTLDELRTEADDLLIALVHPDDRDGLRRSVRAQLAGGCSTTETEYRLLRRDGAAVWVLDRCRLTVVGGEERFYSIVLDIDERKQAEEALKLTLERHRIIMDQATDVIFEWDIHADTLEYSPNWLKKFGYPPTTSAISRRIPCSENIHPEDRASFVRIMEDTAAGVPYSEAQFRIRDGQGRYRWCRIRATTQFDRDERPIKAVGVIVDIDAEKRHEQQLLDMAQRDALTGLLNKRAAQSIIDDRLKQGGVCALMIIDLDHFKQINDRFGHLCGDTVLSDVAAHLKKRSDPGCVLSRIGGDEFLAFLPCLSGREEAARRAEQLLRVLTLIPVQKGGCATLSCSVGVAVGPEDGDDYLSLCRCADHALYTVKNSGRGSYALYQPGPRPASFSPDLSLSAVSGRIDSGDLDYTLAQYAFRMLYSSLDVITAIPQMLEIVGRSCDVSRVYIFENCGDGSLCTNTFEWCGDGVSPEIHNLQSRPYCGGFGDYRDYFDADGVFCCQNIRALHPELYAGLAAQGIESLLQCAIQDDGRFLGFVGFDECRASRRWTREQISSLSLVSNVLSTFLLKQRLKERLARLEGRRPT